MTAQTPLERATAEYKEALEELKVARQFLSLTFGGDALKTAENRLHRARAAWMQLRREQGVRYEGDK